MPEKRMQDHGFEKRAKQPRVAQPFDTTWFGFGGRIKFYSPQSKPIREYLRQNGAISRLGFVEGTEVDPTFHRVAVANLNATLTKQDPNAERITSLGQLFGIRSEDIRKVHTGTDPDPKSSDPISHLIEVRAGIGKVGFIPVRDKTPVAIALHAALVDSFSRRKPTSRRPELF